MQRRRDQFHELLLHGETLVLSAPLRPLRAVAEVESASTFRELTMFRNGSSKKFHETDHVTRCNACGNLFRNAVHTSFTLFRIRNTYNGYKKSLIRGFWSYCSTKFLLNHHVSAKFYRLSVVFPHKTAIPVMVIPECGQSNAT